MTSKENLELQDKLNAAMDAVSGVEPSDDRIYDAESIDLLTQLKEGRYDGDGPEDVAAVIDIDKISGEAE